MFFGALGQYALGQFRTVTITSITATMSAHDRTDQFLGAVTVYDSSPTTSGSGAKVSIIELDTGGSPVSIRES